MSTYRVRKLTEHDPFYYPLVLVGFVALAMAFAVWRTAVVNWGVWFGPPAWASEMFGLATTILFVLTMRRKVRVARRIVRGSRASVDILVPTVNEPLQIIEATVVGAVNVRGVRDVLVLDDGVRDEVREAVQRLGARYVPRVSSEGAKAGNLNHGLLATDAEFVVVLDADHIPLPEFIEHTLGYFDDPGIGFVQTAQSFYNTGSFTFRRRRGLRPPWHEQEMFYGGVQPTKDSTDSAIFAGTSAMLRRSAVDSIGGFPTDTPTEDIHTSLRLHAHGWHSVYLDEPLAYGLEVENLQEYHRTRRRWAVGSLQLLFRHPDSPLRARGLTLPQRLNYLSAMIAHLQGLNRLLYVVTPLAALTTGVAPVTGPYAGYGFAFLAFTVLTLLTVVLFGRGHFHLVHSEVFGLADQVPMLAGMRGLLGGDRRFEVSVKQAGRASSRRLKAVYHAIGALTFVGLALAVVRLVRGEYVAIAAWSAAFLTFSAVYVVIFTVSVRRYERNAVVPAYASLDAAGLYRYVVSLGRGGGPDRLFVTSLDDRAGGAAGGLADGAAGARVSGSSRASSWASQEERERTGQSVLGRTLE